MRTFRSRRFLAFLGTLGLILLPWAVPASPASAANSVTIFAGWAAGEKTDFQSILSYCDSHYHINANYQQASGDLATELATRVSGGNAPDIAALSTPISIAQYVAGGSLQPLTFLPMSRIHKQYSSFWLNEGTIKGKLYSIFMKADVKSLVWYVPKKFQAGHYTIPQTWNQLIALSKKMIKAGKHPWAFGAQDGWTLTDILENIDLSLNGPAQYRKWYLHQIPWTDPSIKAAFTLLNQIVANNTMIAGGRQRALSQRWDAGAKQMVTDPTAEFFQEASFVGAGLRTDLPSDVEGRDYTAFPFPMVKSWPTTPVEVGPNGMVLFHSTPASRALITCLTDPKALVEWAKRGGYISPNNALPASAYPDPLFRTIATMLAKAGKANLVVGDASDEMPTALGSDYEFTALQQYFKDPSSLPTVLKNLENKAKQVYH